MFASYPGFEDLTLRVGVKWRGRTRTVNARIERWPEMRDAFVVCDFDDKEEGEWIIRMGKVFYAIGSPKKLLCRYVAYDVTSHAPQNRRKFSTNGEEKLRRLVRQAFSENSANCGVTRAIRIDELPEEPSIVIESTEGLFWCLKPQWSCFIPFRLTPAPTSLSDDAREAHQQLLGAWRDASSEAHFSWEWASLSKEQRLSKSTGFYENWDELGRVMQLILRSSTKLWRLDAGWNWWFNIETGSGFINSHDEHEAEGIVVLEPWETFLSAHFRPERREDWLTRYLCVGKFWREDGISEDVYIENVTAHEQLEAKLALRDWLRDAATPAVAAALMASLES